MLPILYINIDERTDRKIFLESQLQKLNLKFKRVSAITPIKIQKQKIEAYKAYLSPSELACTMSHCKAWQTVINKKYTYALILEDDIVLSSLLTDFLKEFSSIKTEIPLLRIETRLEKLFCSKKIYSFDGNFEVRRSFGDCDGAAAYLISASYCKKLLKYKGIFEKPIDHILFKQNNFCHKNNVNFQLFPGVGIPAEYYTKLHSDNNLDKVIKSSIHDLRLYRINKKAIKNTTKLDKKVSSLFRKLTFLPGLLMNALLGNKSLFKRRVLFKRK